MNSVNDAQQNHQGGSDDESSRSGGVRRIAGLAVVARRGARVVAARPRSAAARARPRAATSMLNENSWAGSTANVYVVKYVLEKKLGCKVKVTNITEGQPNFQAMADGKIDVVLEDWQNLAVVPAVHEEQAARQRSAATGSPA